MVTDPSTILAAAGVSLPEVEEYVEATSDYNRDADRRVLSAQASGAFFVMDRADAAIVALANELAKWKWVAEHQTALKPSDGFDREWVAVERPEEMSILTAIYDEPSDPLKYEVPRYSEEAQHE